MAPTVPMTVPKRLRDLRGLGKVTGNAQRPENVSAPMAYSRCGFVLEGHIRGSKLNPDRTVGCPPGDLGDTSPTCSIVVAN